MGYTNGQDLTLASPSRGTIANPRVLPYEYLPGRIIRWSSTAKTAGDTGKQLNLSMPSGTVSEPATAQDFPVAYPSGVISESATAQDFPDTVVVPGAFICIGGTWKNTAGGYVLVGGAWKPIVGKSVIVGGAWKS